jgi:hypothetical protein
MIYFLWYFANYFWKELDAHVFSGDGPLLVFSVIACYIYFCSSSTFSISSLMYTHSPFSSLMFFLAGAILRGCE